MIVHNGAYNCGARPQKGQAAMVIVCFDKFHILVPFRAEDFSTAGEVYRWVETVLSSELALDTGTVYRLRRTDMMIVFTGGEGQVPENYSLSWIQ